MMNKLNSVFLESWDNLEDMCNSFEIEVEDLEGYEVVVAAYDTSGYDGSAFVLLRKDDKYYEVHGSHCSCNGLEDCWEPEETHPEALKKRYDDGNGYVCGENLAWPVIAEHFGWKQK
jgi:hypothetical protein